MPMASSILLTNHQPEPRALCPVLVNSRSMAFIEPSQVILEDGACCPHCADE